MTKQVVVVTGSSGRIGRRIISRLGEAYQPVGLDFVGTISTQPAMEFIYVDLSSEKSVDAAFNRIAYAYGSRIASVIHLAAYYSFTGERLDLYDTITVEGTHRVLQAMKRFEVEQFLFTSTMLVHRPTRRGVIQNEDSPIEGKWHYPASKVKTEQLIRQECQVPYVIVRIAGCYDEECNCIPLSQHMARIYEKQFASYLFPGNVSHGVPYTHFDDLSEMILVMLEKRKELPKDLTLLCCEEDSISYRDLQTAFGKWIHHKDYWPMVRIPKCVAKLGAWMQNHLPFFPKPFIKPWMIDLADDNYEFSMEKARRELWGWTPKRSLRQTLPKMVENLKNDPKTWYQRHGIAFSRAACKQMQKDKGMV